MRYLIVGLLSALLLAGCSSKKEISGESDLKLDSVSNIRIATSKGKPEADLLAKNDCGKYQKTAVFSGSHLNHDATARVYSYVCK